MDSVIGLSVCRLVWSSRHAFGVSIGSVDVLEKVIAETACIIAKVDLGAEGLEVWDLWRRRASRSGRAGSNVLDVCRHDDLPIRAPEPTEEARGALGLLLGGDAGIAAAVRSAVRLVEVMLCGTVYCC